MDATRKGWRTPKQLARLLDVSANTVRRWMREGRLGGKLGGRWRASEEDALAMMGPAAPARRRA